MREIVRYIAAVVVLILVMVPALCYGELKREFTIGDLGAWTQGMLTPVIIIIAWLSWIDTRKTQKDQQEYNNETNRLSATALMLTHIHDFYGYINYQSACALNNGRPPRDTIPEGNFECVAALLNILDDIPQGDVVAGDRCLRVRDKGSIVGNHEYEALKRNLLKILTLLDRAQVGFMVDQRIQLLARSLGLTVPES